MDRHKKKEQARKQRHIRVRAKVKGTAERPRLAVYRSLRYIYVQLIDDTTGKTLVSASDREITKKETDKLRQGSEGRKAKTALAYAVGQLVAAKALKAGIKTAVFDRGGFTYAGRVAAVAEGAREKGLEL
ncbi:50S ribosomal protein L18 [Parcubacteria bacterium SG8_24]|nr:MAG: 50S ribosomal protein L18 [Parcubacteria bacterium SG8_24]